MSPPLNPFEIQDNLALEARIHQRVNASLADAFPEFLAPLQLSDWFTAGQFDFAVPLPPLDVMRVVRPEGRPAVIIRSDRPVFASGNAWQESLDLAQAPLLPAVQATGRIALLNESQSCRGPVGTGWLVGDGIVVTNRHVARCFALGNEPPFRFRPDLTLFDVVHVEIDFKTEHGSAEALAFPVVDVLDIAPEGEPDLAFLRLGNPHNLAMPSPVALATESERIQPGRFVAAIGYPGKPAGNLEDGELAVIEAIFTAYGIKTLSPGQITSVGPGDSFVHDCSTLEGNSGSMIVDITDGAVLGIHFHGRFLTGNTAVAFHAIQRRLQQLEG